MASFYVINLLDVKANMVITVGVLKDGRNISHGYQS